MELKNLSELMINLAYNSLFMQDKTLTAEISDIFSKIIKIQKETLKIIFKVKVNDDERVRVVNLLEYVKDYANAAVNISGLITGGTPVIIKDMLDAEDNRMITVTLNPNDSIINKTLKESKIHTITGVTVISIKRAGNWVFDLDKDLRFKAGDLIVGIGNAKAGEDFKKFLTE